MADKKFYVRNVTCDYYLDSLNDFSKLKYNQKLSEKNNKSVHYTVMRIFGITEAGSKCCVHIHGFLPYIIFRTKSRLTPQLRAFFVQIIHDIISQTHFAKFFLNVDGDVIFDIYDEQGFSMYGYYEKKDYFIRVVFCDPRIVRICTYAFQKESNNVSAYLQPYNAHISTILQFFIDFGIYGMDYVCLSTRYQRLNININEKEDNIKWNQNLKKSPLKPQSNMELEFDVFTDDIVNQFETMKSRFNIQGLQFIWEEEHQRCKLLGTELESYTPGYIGTPEVWTEYEEALKNDLKITLFQIKKNIQQTGNRLSNNSYPSDLSTILNSEQHLTQKVIDDINTQILHNEELGRNDPVPNCLSFGIGEDNWKNNNGNSIFDEDEDIDENERVEFEPDFSLKNVNFNYLKNNKNNVSELDLDSSSSDESIKDYEVIGEQLINKTVKQNNNIINDKMINITNTKVKRSNQLHPLQSSSLIIYNNGKNNLLSKNNTKCQLNHLNSPKNRLFNKSFNITDTLCETPSCFEMPMEKKENELTKSQNEYNELICLVKSAVNNLCVLSVEILALSTGSKARLIADPKHDYILAIFYAIDTDVCNRSNNNGLSVKSEKSQFCGRIALNTLKDLPAKCYKKNEIAPIFVSHELQLFAELTNIVQKYNPDILIGYDTSRFSWGYLYDRAHFLGLPFIYNISRVKDIYGTGIGMRQTKRECFSPPHGRIQLEVWQILRREDTNLHTYQFSSVVKIILKRKIVELKPETIINAFNESEKNNVLGVKELILNHFVDKCILNIDLLDKLEVFIKTSQMARVYGIQFSEVLTRGSQFRVESILLRLAARKKFMTPSISDKQRNLMDSPETIPLNMEPESGIYYDPIIVLDFQSLYPSICIAYNYCFTTCIGKLSRFKFLSVNRQSFNSSNFTLGAINNYELYDVDQILKLLDNNLLNISPAGGIFLKMQQRKSLLAQMLNELLETRVMVKKAIKKYNSCEKLIRLLDARQLALKLVANVTYGYTAANWSGRMPCEELADAIVSKGRETLERAIQYIHENSTHAFNSKTNNLAKYGNARVIYGDTDSLFILLKGHSRSDAFYIGNQIASEITAANPYPIKLKFEKVMQPSILMTKKRYVGMSYETSNQTIGKFDAKGIETVRRDACEFVSKTMKNVLRILFDVKPPGPDKNKIETITTIENKYNGGLDAALQYLKYRLKHLREISPNEFILSNEFRDHYSSTTVLPVKKIAEELNFKSSRLMPIRGERISYVIVSLNTIDNQKKNYTTNIFGSSISKFASLTGSVTSNAVFIDDYLSNSKLDINYDYYITRQLFPALMRIFQFTGIRLKWQSGEANRIYCLGCLTPNFYPWCSSCTKSARGLVLRRSLQSLKYFLIRKNCRLCLCPSKSIQNVENLLAFNLCNNFECENRQELMLAERIILPHEFKCHIASHSLNYLNYF